MENDRKDEITLKELILISKDYLLEIRNNWKLIIIAVVPFLIYYIYKQYKDIPRYQSEIEFVVEGANGVNGGIGGLLGSIGIQKGGSLNPFKVLKVGKSGKILADVLFDKKNEKLSIANEILQVYHLPEEWSKKMIRFKDFSFDDTLKTNKDSQAFKKIHFLIWGNESSSTDPIVTFNLDDNSGVFRIRSRAYTEALSSRLTHGLYNTIKHFFEDEVYSRQKQTISILSTKMDSIVNLKKLKISQLAQFEDRNYGLINKTNSVQRSLLNQDIQALNMTYVEMLKKYELSDVNLKDQQPLFIEINRTMNPLSIIASSIYKNVVLAIIYGSILAILIIITRKLYRDILKN